MSDDKVRREFWFTTNLYKFASFVTKAWMKCQDGVDQ